MGRSILQEGLDIDLSNLSNDDRDSIITMMSRIMEDSYRRGFQHGDHFARTGVRTVCISDWRFYCDLCMSIPPNINTHVKDTAIDRLMMEYSSDLMRAGIVK